MESRKKYVDANELHSLSVELAKKIKDSEFKPTWIVALWRGGCPVGMTIQGFLKHHGQISDHIAVRTSSYDTEGKQRQISVHGIEYIVKNITNEDRLLIVDDVFDSGRSIEALIHKLQRKLRKNYPAEIKIATVFYKPENNKVNFQPDFYSVICNTSTWLVFPHEFEDLTKEEIKNFMGIDMI